MSATVVMYLLLILISSIFTIAFQLILIISVLCQNKTKCTLEYVFLMMTINSLVQWTLNLIDVVFEPRNPYNHIIDTLFQCSFFVLVYLFVISLLCTSYEFEDSLYSIKNHIKHSHLSICIVIGTLIVLIFVFSIFHIIPFEMYQLCAWIIMSLIIICMAHLTVISNKQLFRVINDNNEDTNLLQTICKHCLLAIVLLLVVFICHLTNILLINNNIDSQIIVCLSTNASTLCLWLAMQNAINISTYKILCNLCAAALQNICFSLTGPKVISTSDTALDMAGRQRSATMSDTIGLKCDTDDADAEISDVDLTFTDTMHCKFRLNHENKMEYKKVNEFEIAISVKEYWDMFCANGCPFGQDKYLIADYNSNINVSDWRLTTYNNADSNEWFGRCVNWCTKIEIPQWVTHIISSDITNMNVEVMEYQCEVVDDFYIIHRIVRLKNGPMHQTFKIYQKRIVRQRVENNLAFTNIETWYVVQWLKFNLFSSQIENKAKSDIDGDCAYYKKYINDKIINER